MHKEQDIVVKGDSDNFKHFFQHSKCETRKQDASDISPLIFRSEFVLSCDI